MTYNQILVVLLVFGAVIVYGNIFNNLISRRSSLMFHVGVDSIKIKKNNVEVEIDFEELEDIYNAYAIQEAERERQEKGLSKGVRL